MGDVRPGFEPVREVFAANFREHGDLGAAVAVYHRGLKVVDPWGGVADPMTGRAWSQDTLQVVFSVTKAAVAVCAHMLAERGELDVDAPVREYWPEFGQAGKAHIPVRWLLSHQAGLVALDEPVALAEALAWDPVVRALAGQRPQWEPGTAHGIHTRTFGWLAGEVVRRVSGRTPGELLAAEIAGPLGLDFHIGLAPAEAGRVSRTVEDEFSAEFVRQRLHLVPDSEMALARAIADPNALMHRARQVTSPEPDFNDPAVLAAEVPASNGVCTARALARFFAALVGDVDGQRLLSPKTVADATAQQTAGVDRVMLRPTRFSTGFMLYPAGGTNDNVFGYTGRGGSMGYADIESQIGFGYVTNTLIQTAATTRRATDLAKAVRACLR